MRHEAAGHVGPIEARPRGFQKLGLHRRMADHIQKLLVAPDIVLKRRDVEIADHHYGR